MTGCGKTADTVNWVYMIIAPMHQWHSYETDSRLSAMPAVALHKCKSSFGISALNQKFQAYCKYTHLDEYKQ